ncbi:MAG: hypothetical protein U0871_03975 [Gemmataceae bacterium]
MTVTAYGSTNATAAVLGDGPVNFALAKVPVVTVTGSSWRSGSPRPPSRRPPWPWPPPAWPPSAWPGSSGRAYRTAGG